MVSPIVMLIYGVSWLFNTPIHGDSTAVLIAAPIWVALDVTYRKISEAGHWFHPHGGGHFFFLPVWLWSIVLFTISFFWE